MALRATRRTELERAGFKNHVLNEWFGHSGAIAQEHYLQVTESDFEQAVGTLGQPSGSVDPLVDPSVSSLTPSMALELLGLWELMDEPSRADLLTLARGWVASSSQ
jgi:hypothetical protein